MSFGKWYLANKRQKRVFAERMTTMHEIERQNNRVSNPSIEGNRKIDRGQFRRSRKETTRLALSLVVALVIVGAVVFWIFGGSS